MTETGRVTMVCHDEEGRIGDIFSGFREDVLRDVDGRLAAEVKDNVGEINPEDQYISGGEIVPRPRMALTVSGTNIAGIPAPCTCTVNGQVYEVDEETLEFESPCPGRYELTFEKWPYQMEVVTVEVAPHTD